MVLAESVVIYAENLDFFLQHQPARLEVPEGSSNRCSSFHERHFKFSFKVFLINVKSFYFDVDKVRLCRSAETESESEDSQYFGTTATGWRRTLQNIVIQSQRFLGVFLFKLF